MLDLDRLASPISDDAPAGDDLRMRSSDVALQTISEARTELLVEEDPGGEGRAADYRAAFRASEEALANDTKDLEIAGYLTEALAYTEGFAGVAAGLELVERLVRDFWTHVHPGVDEDDGEIVLPIRARPLTWLGSSRDFLRAVGNCTIVSSADGRALNWLDYKNSELVDEKKTMADQTAYTEMIEQGYLNGEDWSSRINSADGSALGQTLEHVRACEAALQSLRATCDELFEEDEPNFVELGELFFDIREYLEERATPVAGDAGGDPGAMAAGASVAAPGAAPAAAGPGATAGPIQGRDDALRRLTEVADYFKRTEPHSPISHLISRTVRWGHMPLPELLQEIVKDDDVLDRIWDTLGIKGGGSGGSSDSDDEDDDD